MSDITNDPRVDAERRYPSPGRGTLGPYERAAYVQGREDEASRRVDGVVGAGEVALAIAEQFENEALRINNDNIGASEEVWQAAMRRQAALSGAAALLRERASR